MGGKGEAGKEKVGHRKYLRYTYRRRGGRERGRGWEDVDCR